MRYRTEKSMEKRKEEIQGMENALGGIAVVAMFCLGCSANDITAIIFGVIFVFCLVCLAACEYALHMLKKRCKKEIQTYCELVEEEAV